MSNKIRIAKRGQRMTEIGDDAKYVPVMEAGVPLLKFSIVGGSDKLTMLRATPAWTQGQTGDQPLVKFMIRGCCQFMDQLVVRNLELHGVCLQVSVDSVVPDNGFWVLYGRIVENGAVLPPQLSLAGLEYCAEYNPSMRHGSIRIKLYQPAA